MKLIRSLATAVAVVASSLVLLSGSAEAASASASSCLQGLSNPNDVVNTYNGIILRCGGVSSGVIHINNGHPIDRNGHDDVNVDRCMDNILAYGHSTPTAQNNTGLQIQRPASQGGGTATIVWRTSSKSVVTMYTSDSNNWAACARFPN